MQYRIVKDDFNGYEVQARRWWFPFWIQCSARGTGVNTHSTMSEALAFIERREDRVLWISKRGKEWR